MPKSKVRTVGDLRRLLRGLPADTRLVACWPRGRMSHRYDPEVELADVRVAHSSDTRRKFVALLVVPDFAALEEWAKGQGIPTNDRRALLAKPAVQKKMEQEVLGGLGDLSEVEMPKKLGLLATPFSIENNTLTLTDKVRRRAVQEIYAPLIDRFYDPANEHRTVFAG